MPGKCPKSKVFRSRYFFGRCKRNEKSRSGLHKYKLKDTNTVATICIKSGLIVEAAKRKYRKGGKAPG